ncbi:MAG: hypothetical protein P8N49_00860 [Opitutales bacterium]|nr:hypothetical protein [Opitutales bacterium]
MKVAIVHYHLQPGGVTRVIENTLQAWESADMAIESVVLSGRAYPGESIKNIRVVNGLDYALPGEAISPSILAERMETAARESLGSSPDIWHIHNHSLGKNPALPLAISLLAEKGASMLLQPHDFAEDGRPGNFTCLRSCYPSTYPSSERIHYAALNHRDLSFLKLMLAGLPSKAHLLANAIPVESNQTDGKICPDLPENLFLYPVRAVRRKNLGELALLSMVHPEKHFANSLGPTNPNFKNEYNKWIDFAAKENLNLTFGLSENSVLSFPQMVNHAKAIITTSVAEGFGLGFLEPWTFGKGLCGRNLPEITSDFTNLGIELQNLYERCDVSIDLLDEPARLKEVIRLALQEFYSSYAKPLPIDSVEQAYHSIVQKGNVDFGRLDENLQRQILLKLKRSPALLDQINKQIPLKVPSIKAIEKNNAAVLTQFSTLAYGNNLLTIYKQILDGESDKIHYAEGEKLLTEFLSPLRLNLLRTS